MTTTGGELQGYKMASGVSTITKELQEACNAVLGRHGFPQRVEVGIERDVAMREYDFVVVVTISNRALREMP